ncbi:CotO family spore coat protein [Ornithinibacillus sp. 179-J 7C1 HS]|uniref:CotO family spore coat protein n=1 Tax=Ornithinibacillus sp. 179-J 7C1 HS TaxID=3142384 RepID=UPI0039A0B449
MKRKKYAREPLLYIHQPTISSPTAPMQHSYTTPRKTKTTSDFTPQSTKEPEKTQNIKKKRPSLDAFSKGVTNTNEVMEQPKVKKKRPSIQIQEDVEAESSSSLFEESIDENSEERKKFKDMSIMEKIDYFINTPSHLPRMRCEVITDEKKYRGIILEKENELIAMRVGRRTTRISINDIKEIRLLGF